MPNRAPTAEHLATADASRRAGQIGGEPKPYLSIAELSRLTPWTADAVRRMIGKGILRSGEHFFYVGRRAVFKWEAVVAFIERPTPPRPVPEGDRVPHYREQINRGAKA